MIVLEGLYYTENHEWIRVEGEQAYIGITDYAQHELGDIVYVEMPEVDDEIEAEDTFGVVESVKAVSDLYMPVSGKVLEINEELEDAPELVNKDAYESWMIQIELSDKSELGDLMSGEEYQEYCNKEE